RVVRDAARVVYRDAHEALGHPLHRLAETLVFVRAHLVDYEVGHEGLDVARERLGGARVDARDLIEDLRRAAVVRLVAVLHDQIDDRPIPERSDAMVEAPQEGGPEATVPALDG